MKRDCRVVHELVTYVCLSTSVPTIIDRRVAKTDKRLPYPGMVTRRLCLPFTRSIARNVTAHGVHTTLLSRTIGTSDYGRFTDLNTNRT